MKELKSIDRRARQAKREAKKAKDLATTTADVEMAKIKADIANLKIAIAELENKAHVHAFNADSFSEDSNGVLCYKGNKIAFDTGGA